MTEDQPPILSFLKERALWILIFIGIVLFSKPLFFGQTFFFGGDLILQFLPAKKLIGSLLRRGEFPFWNPYLHGGQPFLANLNSGVLYPTNLLYVFLPPLTAFNIDIVFHLLLCSTSAYLLARVLRFRPVAAFCTALVFGFCGYSLSHGSLFNRLLALPYIPLTLLFWTQWLSTAARKWLLLSALSISVQFFAGAPETCMFTIGNIFLWSAFYQSRKRAVLAALAVCFMVIGFTAIQTLPTAELVQQSPREKFNSYVVFTNFSLHPTRLPELVLPSFLGDVANRSRFWGAKMEDNGGLFVSSIYFGALTLLLALYGGLSHSCNEVLPRDLRIALLVIFFISLFLCLGRFLPGFEFLFHIPVIRLFRYPLKFMSAGLLPVSLLCAAAIEHQRSEWKPSSEFLLICWMLFLILCAAFFFLPLDFFFGESNSLIASGIRSSFIHAIVIFLAACLLFQIRLTLTFAYHAWLIAALLAVDLVWAGVSVNPYIPRTIFSKRYPIVELIKKEISDGCLYRPYTKYVRIHAPSPDIKYGIEWDLSTLNWSTSNFFEIPLIYDITYEALESSRLLDLRLKMSELPWEQRVPFLSVGGVTMILTSDELNVPALQRLARFETNSDLPFFAYKNREAVQRIAFYTSGVIAHSESQAIAMLQNPGFDPGQHVVLENANPPQGSCLDRSAEIRNTEQRSNSITYSVQNRCAGYLAISEPYYKGWRVSVDQQEAPIVPSNGAFFAIFLPPGEHIVLIRYLPRSFFIGTAISALALLAAAGWVAAARRGKPSSKSL